MTIEWRPLIDGEVTEVADCGRLLVKGDRLLVEGDKLTVWMGSEGSYALIPADFRIREATEVPNTPRPDWSQAPAWAQWWAVDGSGATWFEYEPIADKGGDWTVGNDWDDMGQWDGAGDIDIPLGIDWRLLKEQRPAA